MPFIDEVSKPIYSKFDNGNMDISAVLKVSCTFLSLEGSVQSCFS